MPLIRVDHQHTVLDNSVVNINHNMMVCGCVEQMIKTTFFMTIILKETVWWSSYPPPPKGLRPLYIWCTSMPPNTYCIYHSIQVRYDDHLLQPYKNHFKAADDQIVAIDSFISVSEQAIWSSCVAVTISNHLKPK